MTRTAANIETVIGTVRGLFHRLRAIGDTLYADLGVTTAMRGVMESLSRGGAMTVPQMARQRPVSRQHIQMLVNQLSDAALCAARPNPEHKRSVLIELTDKGRAVFADIRQREATAITDLFGDIDLAELTTCGRVLGQMTSAIDGRLQHAHQEEKDNDC